jgi:hypothetical protein
VPCAKCKGSGRELVAMEAPADAPPATPRCECGHTRTFHNHSIGACSHGTGVRPTCDCPAYRETAAEPPAPPAQVLDLDALETEHKGCEDYGRYCHDSGHAPNQPVMSLIAECRALRAGVARLQEELTQRTQERDDSDLAFNTANDIIGKLEAEAQALRERLTHATYAVRLFRTDTYDLGAEAFCDKLLALLSPAQEAP